MIGQNHGKMLSLKFFPPTSTKREIFLLQHRIVEIVIKIIADFIKSYSKSLF